MELVELSDSDPRHLVWWLWDHKDHDFEIKEITMLTDYFGIELVCIEVWIDFDVFWKPAYLIRK